MVTLTGPFNIFLIFSLFNSRLFRLDLLQAYLKLYLSMDVDRDVHGIISVCVVGKEIGTKMETMRSP